MQFWPLRKKIRCKKRLTKINQYLIRMRRMAQTNQPLLVSNTRKVERREKRREAKALIAAKLDNVIERQLLDRLKAGVYKEMYQFPVAAFDKALKTSDELKLSKDIDSINYKKQQKKSLEVKLKKKVSEDGEEDDEEDEEMDYEDEEDEEEEQTGKVRQKVHEFVPADEFEESDEEDSDIEDYDEESDDEELEKQLKKQVEKMIKKSKPKVEISY